MLFSLEDFRVLRREACQSFQVNHGNNFLVCKPVLTPTAVQCVVPSTMRLPTIAAPPLNIFGLHEKHQGGMRVRMCFKMENFW